MTTTHRSEDMTDDSEELRAALLMITHKANEANIHRDEDDVLETIIEIARAALAAAPQPAPVDREALADLIFDNLEVDCNLTDEAVLKVADALLTKFNITRKP